MLNFGKKLIHFLSRLPVYFILKRRKESAHELNGRHSWGALSESEKLSSFSVIYFKETSICQDIWWIVFKSVRPISSLPVIRPSHPYILPFSFSLSKMKTRLVAGLITSKKNPPQKNSVLQPELEEVVRFPYSLCGIFEPFLCVY